MKLYTNTNDTRAVRGAKLSWFQETKRCCESLELLLCCILEQLVTIDFHCKGKEAVCEFSLAYPLTKKKKSVLEQNEKVMTEFHLFTTSMNRPLFKYEFTNVHVFSQ